MKKWVPNCFRHFFSIACEACEQNTIVENITKLFEAVRPANANLCERLIG